MQGSAVVFQSAKLPPTSSAVSPRNPVRLNKKKIRLSAEIGHVSTSAHSCRGKVVSGEGWRVSSVQTGEKRHVPNSVVVSRLRRKDRVYFATVPALIGAGRRTPRCRSASSSPLHTSLFTARARQDTKFSISPFHAPYLDTKSDWRHTKKLSPCRALYYQPSPPFGSR